MGKGVSTFGADIVRRVREDAASWLAFAALLAWMFGLYWSNVLLAQLSLGATDLLQMRALWLAAEAVTLATMVLGAARIEARGVPWALGAGASLFAGTVLVLFGPAIVPSDALRLGGVVLTGMGSAALLLLLGISFARKGAKALLIDVALALVAASLLDGCLLLAPPVAQQLALALLPAVAAALFVLAARAGAARTHPAMPGATGMAGTPGAAGGFSTVRIVALPAVVGLAYGLMQRLTEGAFAVDDGSGNLVTIVAFALSAVMIALAALFLDSRKLIKVVCFAAIPLIGIAFVMLPLFSGGREAVQGVCIVGFNSFYFMVWALWAGEREGSALPKRFALGLLVLVAAESLGSLLGVFVVRAVEGSGATLAVVSFVVVYLLLMAGILSFDRSMRALQGPAAAGSGACDAGAVKVGVPETPAAARFDALGDMERWAARYGLSARECEVFEMLARGRNRAYISKELVVSDNTTRTHMKNVYRKLGVHSQQELIDLVDGKPR